jgi:hypothetical protein
MLILAGALVRHVDDCRGRTAPAYSAGLGAVGLYVLIAYGRGELGVEQAGSPRYVYVATALLFPAVVLALTWLVGQSRVARGVVCVAFLAVALHGVSVLRENAGIQASREMGIKATLVAAARIASSDRYVPGALPEPVWSPNVTVGDLVRWWRAGELRPQATSAVADLTAALNLQAGITVKPLVASPSTDNTCESLAPGESRAFVIEKPTSDRLESRSMASLVIFLQDRDRTASSDERVLVIPPGLSYLNLLDAGTVANVKALEGAVELCQGEASNHR